MASHRKTIASVTALVVGVLFSPPSSSGQVVYVKHDAAGSNDGSNWKSAFVNLQDALTAAANSEGDIAEVWVAEGTYTPGQPGDSRTATFELVSGVTLLGGFRGDEANSAERDFLLHPSVLSGDLNRDDEPGFVNMQDNSYHVVTGSGADASAILDGFTIRAGNADGTSADQHGGGVHNETGSPTIRNCTLTGNAAIASGGGMYNAYGSSPVVTDCDFSGNVANNGGGIYNIDESNPILTRSNFSGNSANSGGGMRNYECAPLLTDCTFEGNSGLYGGGIRNFNSDLILEGCTFVDNSAAAGGGMYNDQATVSLTGCDFIGNASTSDTEGGGGMYNSESTITLLDCDFTGNTAINDRDGGGGMYDYSSDVVLERCNFSANTANQAIGGALSNVVTSYLLVRCNFSQNSASVGGAVNVEGEASLFSCTFTMNSSLYDAAALNFDSEPVDPLLVNCLFAGNQAGGSGGAVVNNSGCVVDAINCTFFGNTAGQNAGGWWQVSGNASLANCIFWGNSDSSGTGEAAQIYNTSSDPFSVSHTCVQGLTGGLGGVGNTGADPLFVDADGADDLVGTADDNLQLLSGSPCIDSARKSVLPSDAADLDGDEDVLESVPLDLVDNTRVVDDPGTEDSGPGSWPMVDMGALEFQPPACQGDANGDGTVNPLDSGFVLTQFGCDVGGGDPDCDVADQNADGLVDPLDVGYVLARFGGCP